jgi:hypothetical protein
MAPAPASRSDPLLGTSGSLPLDSPEYGGIEYGGLPVKASRPKWDLSEWTWRFAELQQFLNVVGTSQSPSAGSRTIAGAMAHRVSWDSA